MNRLNLLRFLACLLLASSIAGAATPETPPPSTSEPPAQSAAPKPPDIGDLRKLAVQGRFRDAAKLCDVVVAHYTQLRDAAAPASAAQFLDTSMAGYCLYAKSQLLALAADPSPARTAFSAAQAYRGQHPEIERPETAPTWDEMEEFTRGLLLESSGQVSAAMRLYFRTPNSAKATGRLALLYLRRGDSAQAHTWALFHPEEPTSQYVLAKLAFAAHRLPAARQYANRATGLLIQAQQKSQEFMPLYFAEAADIRALRVNLAKIPAQAPSAPAKPPAS
jgi:hypothetical protein